jgi:hypothetical protein
VHAKFDCRPGYYPPCCFPASQHLGLAALRTHWNAYRRTADQWVIAVMGLARTYVLYEPFLRRLDRGFQIVVFESGTCLVFL